MRFHTAFLALFLSLVAVNASSHLRDSLEARKWHSRGHLSHKVLLEKKSPKNGCSRRGNQPANSSSTEKPSSKAPEKTSSPKPSSSPNQGQNSPGGGGSGGKLLVTSSKQCGSSDAVAKTTTTSGPNGNINFLNCGIDGGGWTPPRISINEVVVVSLSEALKSSDSPFQACKAYLGMFNNYGKQYNIPPIFLASFAMQESSCKPGTVGGAGEQGLMQITKDKCGGAPGGNCKDPDFNIRTGAKYFADLLKSLDDDVLLSIGQYNGWRKGLTVKAAEAAKNTGCCRCQQNLDYLHQFLNGWCQNINPYDLKLGLYFNLNICAD